MIKLICLQGIPGSGKTTFVQKLRDEARENGASFYVVSADAFMVEKDGRYQFNPERLPQCHGQCFLSAINMIRMWDRYDEKNCVLVVDNVNACVEHISPYALLAEAFGCEFSIIRLQCPRDVALSRNVHNVPSQTVARIENDINNFYMMRGWKLEVVKTG